MLHCPTAAAACLRRILVGRAFICSLLIPTAIAPEDTRITSYPMFCISDKTQASRSKERKSLIPISLVSVEVPTFTTIRF
ncbi:hypothetical protein SDC9_201623 [bioreactor metagenome]|uniref:Uncharacterized protein n=1 Tax=bioreactor metagenome TaxID=1076179 RepID=A0A645J0C1_9ZZZZ